MLRGTDGYDYEDLGARVRDEKAPTLRNRALEGSHSYAREKWPGQEAAYVRSYRETYDYYADQGHPSHMCAASAHAQANFSAEYARGQDPAYAEQRQQEILDRGGLLYTGVPPSRAEETRARLTELLHAKFRADVNDASDRLVAAARATVAADRARSSAAGACGAHPGQAPADPVHAAD